MTTTKLKKATFKHIESEMYAYKETLREIERLKKDMIFCKESDDENIGQGANSSRTPGRPTEQIATRIATHKKLQKLEEIANAVEKVYIGLPESHRKLITLRYWTKPQTRTWDGVADELHVSKRQAMRWRDETVYLISEVLGWR